MERRKIKVLLTSIPAEMHAIIRDMAFRNGVTIKQMYIEVLKTGLENTKKYQLKP